MASAARLRSSQPATTCGVPGLTEKSEPLEAARRELQEETGLHGGEWVEVAAVLSSPGFTDERIHLFVATGLEEGDEMPSRLEPKEMIMVLPASATPSIQ